MQRHTIVNFRLLVLTFLEYFVWGAWIVPISSYMNGNLGFSGTEIGWICGASALGALVSPLFVGYVADRYVATEKMLAILHLLGALCLYLAVRFHDFPGLMTLVVIDALFFMPTLSLVNNLVFRHLDDATRFPRIVVGGDLGWITAGLIVGFVLGERSGSFFLLASAAEAVLALYCLTLPYTPPKGGTQSAREKLGLSAVSLLKERAFLVFAIAIPLVTISKTYYTTWTNAFLAEISIPKPAAMMTLSQLSELGTMIVMPWIISKVGLKNILMLGMMAWTARYLLFAAMHPVAVVAGLLLHGFSYGFVVTGSSMYAARVAPPGMSARAQSFVTLLILGIGMFAGAQVAGYTGQSYQAVTISVARPANPGGYEQARASLPEWNDLVSSTAIRGTPANPMARREEWVSVPATVASPERMIPMGAQGVRYASSELKAALQKADRDADGSVSRDDWERLRIHAWPQIWTWAGGIAVLACLLFWIGGCEPKPVAGEGEPR